MAGNEKRSRTRIGATIALVLGSSCAAHKTTAPLAAPVDPCDYYCRMINTYIYLLTVYPDSADKIMNEILQSQMPQHHYRLCAGELDKDGFLLEVCP
ncbi:MAG TPA: hypothetical protein VFA12_10090 [Stellaceae bacterium]|nr:hypothetical protein [Pseudolabrys sp.]HZT88311.1 hypothetical protein [Stellaceae bacterium]